MHNPIKKFLPILLVFASMLFTACGGSTNGNEEVVAKVGSKDIKLIEVDRLIKQQLDQSPGAVLTPAELAGARFTVLDQMIQEEVMFQKAQKENLVPDDAKVNQELQKNIQASGLTQEQWQASLKQAGLSEEEAKEKLRRQLAIAALQDKEKTRVASPTDDEVKKYFEDHKSEFVAQRGVEFSMILVDPRNNGQMEDAIGDAASETKATAIHTQLKGGYDFATLASQRSEDPATSIRGGKVGFANEDQLKQSFPSRPEIPSLLMSMTPGQYTEPIKDNLSGGWYIFKVDNRRDRAENLTVDNPQVRQSIVETLLGQRQRVLFNALMVMAMNEANVKNHLAERIVQDPKRIADMKPSALLQQSSQQQQPAPTPRVENQNQSTPATTNGNTAAPAANSNARPANANR